MSSCRRWCVPALLLALATTANAQGSDRMRVHFIDVGQGSATLLEFKCGAILIDTGAAPATSAKSLGIYLEEFFRLRPDLDRTLSAVYLTHCHSDHTFGLADVVKSYKVKNYVDDGIRKGSGLRFANAMLSYIKDHPGTLVSEVFDRKVRAVTGRKGLTNTQIDSLQCDECDPEIRILAGGFETADKPKGWSKSAFDNLNNHSLVIRASLGKASILVTGDLETEGIKRLIEYYKTTTLLDTDILVAGHHGAKNGLTADLVKFASPQVGIISCGRWNDGYISATKAQSFTTYAYGHPSQAVVDMFSAGITRTRTPLEVHVANGAKKYSTTMLKKAIYSTGWDGSVVVDAFVTGKIDVKDHGLIATR